jgi:hypothetical protein
MFDVVSAIIFRQWDLFLPGGWSQKSPCFFTVCALYSLNFSVGPHQTLSLFITTFLFTFYHPNTVKNVLRLPDHGWYLTFKSPECISLRRCLATNTSSLQETFGVLHSICHELGGLLLLWSSSNGIFSSQGGQDHKPLHLHSPSPWLMKFSQNPHHTLSLSTTTSHDYLPSEHCGLVSQDSLSCNCPLFSNLSIRSYLAANLCGQQEVPGATPLQSCGLSALFTQWPSHTRTCSFRLNWVTDPQALHCPSYPYLNFSTCPCQTLSLSITTFNGHILPRHCGQHLKIPWAVVSPYLQVLRVSQSLTLPESRSLQPANSSRTTTLSPLGAQCFVSKISSGTGTCSHQVGQSCQSLRPLFPKLLDD